MITLRWVEVTAVGLTHKRAPQTVQFPVVVGILTRAVKLNEKALAAICETLATIRTGFGEVIVLLPAQGSGGEIERCVSEAGFSCRTAAGHSDNGGQPDRTARATEYEIAELSDILVGLVSAADIASKERPPVTRYAQQGGRPIIQIHADTAAAEGAIPEHQELVRGWLGALYSQAGLASDAPLETVKTRMSALANRTAPATRVWWDWIVFLEGVAVCLPLGWLCHRLIGIPLSLIAISALCAVLITMAAVWWVRWRGMQKTWARSRLVAEAARSLIATADCPGIPAWATLAAIPSLRPLYFISRSPPADVPFTSWRDAYLKNRIQGQLQYFIEKHTAAAARRKQFSRWTTVLLDLMMALAFAGAVIAWSPPRPNGDAWIAVFGDDLVKFVLGVGGVCLGISLLLLQILRHVQDLNRRTGRYAQQREILERAQIRLTNAACNDNALRIVEDTESKLLAEVLEWYFQAETAEHFARIREITPDRPVKASAVGERQTAGHFGRVIAGWIGVSGLFVLRVILGRLPWVLASATVVVAWMAYNVSQHREDIPELQRTVSLLDANGNIFNPQPAQAQHGCVVLVHGLYGTAVTKPGGADGASNWMAPCARAICERMATEHKGEPAVCLVNWSEPAQPSEHFHFGLPSKTTLLADLAAVRPQAYDVGDYVAIQLGRMIIDGRIDRNQPFHLIGHSAGGFVVARIAVRLSELGLVKDRRLLRVTVLDTPMADSPVLSQLPSCWPTDFCLTSNGVWKVPFEKVKEATGLHVLQPKYRQIMADLGRAPNHLDGVWQNFWYRISGGIDDFWDAHRSAYGWFLLTVQKKPRYGDEGFNKSPLLAGDAATNAGE